MTTTTEHSRTYTHADLPRLMGLMTGDEKHGPAATSTLDVLWVLYDRVLRVSRSGWTTPSGTGSCCRRGTGRWRTTPC